MKTIILYFSPAQLAQVRNVSIAQIFKEIREKTLPVQMAETGIKIPVTYKFNE